MSPTILLPLLALAQEPSPREFYQDLRGDFVLHQNLKPAGGFSKYNFPEPAGLRITLPAMRRELFPIGIESRLHVSGDFEVTGSYELLAADRPAKGHGVGVNLYMELGQDRSRLAKVCRFNTTGQGHVYLVQVTDRTKPTGGTVIKTFPTTETSGRLRMSRQGAIVTLSVKDATTGEGFRDLLQGEVGTDELSSLRFLVNTGNTQHAVDARLVDFRIRSDSLKPEQVVEAPGPGGVGLAGVGEESVPKGWLLTVEAVAGGLTLVLLGLGAWAYLRRRRRNTRSGAGQPLPVERSPAKAVSFPCPGCGKSIKAKAALAGKKARCPQCSQAVCVPARAS